MAASREIQEIGDGEIDGSRAARNSQCARTNGWIECERVGTAGLERKRTKIRRVTRIREGRKNERG